MISEKYRKRILYHRLLVLFLTNQITASVLQNLYFRQKDEDIDGDIKNGYYEYYDEKIDTLTGKAMEFYNKCHDKLYYNIWSPDCLSILAEYEEETKRLDVKGEMFFTGLWSFIDAYIREYNPSDAEHFDPKQDVGEKELEEKLRAAYEVLERNKKRWYDGT